MVWFPQAMVNGDRGELPQMTNKGQIQCLEQDWGLLHSDDQLLPQV